MGAGRAWLIGACSGAFVAGVLGAGFLAVAPTRANAAAESPDWDQVANIKEAANHLAALQRSQGATRAFGPGHPDLPVALRPVGQPVLIGGTMGTASYILVGTAEGEGLAFSSACHGAGRSMSRHQALKQWRGRDVIEHLASRGILIRSPSSRGVAEEAPGAYKDVGAVVEAAHAAKMARIVAHLEPRICVKG